MKRLLTIVGLVCIQSLCYAQNPAWEEIMTNCYNGVKDFTEDGVDCLNNPKYGCNKCNGQFSFNFNGENYTTGAIMANTIGLTEASASRKNQSTAVMFIVNIYDGGQFSGFVLNFTIFADPLKEDTYKLDKKPRANAFSGIKHGNFVFTIDFKHSGIQKKMRKFDQGLLTITKYNATKRTLDGTFEIVGLLDDSTPVNIKGSFADISF